MKLLHKSLKLYLIFSVIIFSVSVPVFYYLVQDLWITDVDESLVFQQQKVVKTFSSNDFDTTAIKHFSDVASEIDLGINITTLQSPQIAVDSIYYNNIYDTIRSHTEPFRELKSIVRVKGTWYKIVVRKDLVENADLLMGIVVTQAILFVILLTGILILNGYFSKRTWEPFYYILSKLETYKIDSEKQIEVQASDIEEFNKLNNSVQHLTKRNIHIFKSQKEFTENAAHETQTPLAAIKNQVDLLAQDNDLNVNQSEIINRIDKNIRLLTKLNRNLLLLSKIENEQFNKNEEINVSEIVSEICSGFEEQIKLKNISLVLNISGQLVINTNSYLLHSLITNLLTNAIKYNTKNGEIGITLFDKVLKVTNSGLHKPLPEDKIYERFYKQNDKNESSGLGLAIVKRICISLNLEINYQFSEPNKHSFTIYF